MSSPKVYDGNCLCGNVGFQVEGEPFHFVVCHCRNCKQSGGGPYQANAFFKPQQLKVVRGSELLKDFTDDDTRSGNAIVRTFCSHCGSSLFIKPAAGTISIVHVANIKECDHWVPKKEFFGHDKWKWTGDITFQQKKRTAKL